ncbi:MAG: hypothetical protein PHE51_01385 [Eubacteriales bacterium]|nr:hypothetical protein [Eubacteriales bacterium]
MMVNKYIEDINLPDFGYDLSNKKEILDLFLQEEYGYLPPLPNIFKWDATEENKVYLRGSATYKKIIMTVGLNGRECSFPVISVIPNTNQKVPFFVFANFRDAVPDRYYPTEEIIDRGYGVLSFCYQDVTKDNDDFTDGLAGVVYPNGRQEPTDGGKISLWAWVMCRILDYAQDQEELDITKATAIGHSRLGKTALLAGAVDDRFYCTISNDSGCSGAAITRGKRGETIKDIYTNFPYWFCENYGKYMNNEDKLPFEQNMFLSLIAPRLLYVASAQEDIWADPQAEYASCVMASSAYKAMGIDGLVGKDTFPQADEHFHKGNIGYHIRKGTHYLSRYDWNMFMDFLDKK